jgi:hypothetical protein
MQHHCPHCQSKATCRTSRTITVTMRELYMQCHNIECGHTWKSLLAVSHSIVPSQCPNPKVFLPSRHRPEKAADDRQMTLMPAYQSG